MEVNRANNRRIGGTRYEDGAAQSQSSNSVASSSSLPVRRGRKCNCNVRMIMMTAKKGKYAGRKFWRCPFWMMPTTCDMFIWADEENQIFDNDEVDDCRREVQSDAFNYFIRVIEDGRKRAEKLELKLKVERMRLKIVVIMLLCSLIMHAVGVMK